MKSAAQKAPQHEESNESSNKSSLNTPIAVKVDSALKTPKAKLTLTDLRSERSLSSARKAAEMNDITMSGASSANSPGMGAEEWSVLSALGRTNEDHEGRAAPSTNVVHLWGDEAKKVTRPNLNTLIPENVLLFLQKYVDYAERRQIIAQETKIPFTPATIK